MSWLDRGYGYLFSYLFYIYLDNVGGEHSDQESYILSWHAVCVYHLDCGVGTPCGNPIHYKLGGIVRVLRDCGELRVCTDLGDRGAVEVS
jgi:hypothetical protein